MFKVPVMTLTYGFIQVYDRDKGWVGHCAECGHLIRYSDHDELAADLKSIRSTGKLARVVISDEVQSVELSASYLDRAYGVDV